jgi:hypothetical protein
MIDLIAFFIHATLKFVRIQKDLFNCDRIRTFSRPFALPFATFAVNCILERQRPGCRNPRYASLDRGRRKAAEKRTENEPLTIDSIPFFTDATLKFIRIQKDLFNCDRIRTFSQTPSRFPLRPLRLTAFWSASDPGAKPQRNAKRMNHLTIDLIPFFTDATLKFIRI